MDLSQVLDEKAIFGACLVLGLLAVWLVATLVAKRKARTGNTPVELGQTGLSCIRAERRADGDHFFAVLQAVEANQRQQNFHYELTKVEEVAQLAQMIEVSFESEGLHWAIAHYDEPEFRAMADVTDLLDLPDLSPILHNCADVRTRFDDRAFVRLGVDDPSYVAVKERIDELEVSFRRAGGVERVKNAALKYLEEHYDWPP